MLLHARGHAAHGAPEALETVLGRLLATGLTRRAELPTPLELLDEYGGAVEGLLLTTNSDATPADEFAWCPVIYHPCGFPLARIAVPASRAKTQWRQQLDNIIAGIALSTWHGQPDTTAPTATTDDRMDRCPSGQEDQATIRILDIDATSPRATSHGDAQGPAGTSRPHLRRGHWRRQLIGPGRQTTRWTWVRATAVNGTNIPANQVYQLR